MLASPDGAAVLQWFVGLWDITESSCDQSLNSRKGSSTPFCYFNNVPIHFTFHTTPRPEHSPKYFAIKQPPMTFWLLDVMSCFFWPDSLRQPLSGEWNRHTFCLTYTKLGSLNISAISISFTPIFHVYILSILQCSSGCLLAIPTVTLTYLDAWVGMRKHSGTSTLTP